MNSPSGRTGPAASHRSRARRRPDPPASPGPRPPPGWHHARSRVRPHALSAGSSPSSQPCRPPPAAPGIRMRPPAGRGPQSLLGRGVHPRASPKPRAHVVGRRPCGTTTPRPPRTAPTADPTRPRVTSDRRANTGAHAADLPAQTAACVMCAQHQRALGASPRTRRRGTFGAVRTVEQHITDVQVPPVPTTAGLVDCSRRLCPCRRWRRVCWYAPTPACIPPGSSRSRVSSRHVTPSCNELLAGITRRRGLRTVRLNRGRGCRPRRVARSPVTVPPRAHHPGRP